MSTIAKKMRDLAVEVWEERNNLIAFNGPEIDSMYDYPESAQDLLMVHDTLVAMSKDFGGTSFMDPDEVEAPDNHVTIADTIAISMSRAGMDLHDLAQESGVKRTTLSSIVEGETQRPQRRTLVKIEQALELTEGSLERLL